LTAFDRFGCLAVRAYRDRNCPGVFVRFFIAPNLAWLTSGRPLREKPSAVFDNALRSDTSAIRQHADAPNFTQTLFDQRRAGTTGRPSIVTSI
jgi:hypothetical protein